MAEEIPGSIRIRTGDGNEYRYHAVEGASEFYGCNRSDAVAYACDNVPAPVEAIEDVLSREDMTLEQKREIAETCAVHWLEFEVDELLHIQCKLPRPQSMRPVANRAPLSSILSAGRYNCPLRPTVFPIPDPFADRGVVVEVQSSEEEIANGQCDDEFDGAALGWADSDVAVAISLFECFDRAFGPAVGMVGRSSSVDAVVGHGQVVGNRESAGALRCRCVG
nr:hypothetical protein [Halomicroarcula sp. DFY41]